MIDACGLLDRGSPSQPCSRRVVCAFALQDQPDLFERPSDGYIGPVESLLLQVEAALQCLESLVIAASSGQGAAQVVERLRHAEAVWRNASLAQRDGSLGGGDCRLEFGSGGQHVAQVEQRRSEIDVPGSETCFLGAKRLPGKRESLVLRRTAVQNQSAHQNVRSRRRLQRVVPVQGSLLVEFIVSRGFGLLVQTSGQQRSRGKRNVGWTLLPR